MREIKPVSLNFSLKLNKKISFSSFAGTGRMWSSYSGCVSDIILLDLYADEIGRIRIPDTRDKEWNDSIEKIKETSLKWKTIVRPQIRKLTEILQGQSEPVMNSLNEMLTLTDNIIDRKNGMEEKEMYRKFIENITELLHMLNAQAEALNDFQILLNDYSYHLTEKNQRLDVLSSKADSLTEDQKKRLDKIKKDLKNCQRSRKSAISGACLNGVIPSAEIVGGTITVFLSGKTSVLIGTACFFGGSVCETGMGISTFESISLKNKITAAKKKQTNTENEIMGKSIIEMQLCGLAEQTEILTRKVREMCADRVGILSAVRNIELFISSEDSHNFDEWESVRNDLRVIQTVMRILDKTTAKAAVNTKLRTGYDLTGCRTQKEVIGKLKAFAENRKMTDISADKQFSNI